MIEVKTVTIVNIIYRTPKLNIRKCNRKNQAYQIQIYHLNLSQLMMLSFNVLLLGSLTCIYNLSKNLLLLKRTLSNMIIAQARSPSLKNHLFLSNKTNQKMSVRQQILWRELLNATAVEPSAKKTTVNVSKQDQPVAPSVHALSAAMIKIL